MSPEQMKNLHEAVRSVRSQIEALDEPAKSTVYRAVRDMRKLAALYEQPGVLALMLVASEDALKRNS